ncbi:hypothetical protein DCS_06900 [Drechmeria coniospora]|uniref:Small secreted protein n=1 Tax=Drechmeria coniospora TaxID=98403 RepID=A0A151GCW4_DRECN|nr:hypothetical protein DCS_06900 [Drechmeria coniospora]KYK54939.1 hypothetical protein DCS_06900 [Drechmeria coniospora]ODA82430.1 hypothetical protein RJ55_00937 [Drechmeria coniospora]
MVQLKAILSAALLVATVAGDDVCHPDPNSMMNRILKYEYMDEDKQKVMTGPIFADLVPWIKLAGNQTESLHLEGPYIGRRLIELVCESWTRYFESKLNKPYQDLEKVLIIEDLAMNLRAVQKNLCRKQ